MPWHKSANLFQLELIQRYHLRQLRCREFMSLEDAAREWITKRAAKFRAYWLRRQICGVRDLAMLRDDLSARYALSRCA